MTKLWSRTSQQPVKHMTYYAVLGATQEAGCPICRLTRHAVSRYLDNLAYENVNEPGVRADLLAARGFCSHHAWQFADDVHDGLATAIIYADTVGLVANVLTGRPAGDTQHGLLGGLTDLLSRLDERSDAERALDRLLPTKRCPACRFRDRMYRIQLGALVEHLDDGELRTPYIAGGGLCLPHLSAALPLTKTGDQVRLLTGAACRRARAAIEQTTEPAAAAEFIVGQQGVSAVPRPAAENEAAQPWYDVLTEAEVRREVDRAPGCPACAVATAGMDAAIHQLSGGAPHESGLAASLPLSRGLCNNHARRAYTLLRPDQLRAVWQPVIEATLIALQSPPAASGDGPHSFWDALFGDSQLSQPGGAIAERLSAVAECPICIAQRVAERKALALLLEPAAGAAARDQSDWRFDVCLVHLVTALQRCEREDAANKTIASAGAAFRLLRRELHEYIRKQDYHFSGQPAGRESDAPWRGVARIAGVRGLQGTDDRTEGKEES